MKRTVACAIVVGIALSAHLAAAQSGADAESDKVATAKAEAGLEALAKEASEACGTTITATVAWDTFTGSPWKKYSMDSYCGGPLEALKRLCEGANAKKYISKKVKAFRCTFGGKDKRAFSFAKGTMELAVDFEAANADEFARRSLLG